MTLLQAIDELLGNITVTDRQEESIKASLSNLTTHLLEKGNGLEIMRTFTNGSWERDTNIRPLTDIDLFAVLDRAKWQDENGNLPEPQAVLTKIKNYLNDLDDYKDKIKQDRPCVTITLSDKSLDVMPSFEQIGGGYLIPARDLKSWTFSNPEQLTKDLDSVHRLRNYKVKPTIKGVKYWNREGGKLIPSYHIEEAAIAIFLSNDFTNYEESIRIWFSNAEYYLQAGKFDSSGDFDVSIKRIRKVKDKLKEAREHFGKGEEVKAKQIWKDVFGKEFPEVEESEDEEAKAIAQSLREGSLKIASAGLLSTSVGYSIPASKGYFGDVSEG